MLPSVSGALNTVEVNHLGHFKWLPENLGFRVADIAGVNVINCGLKSSMFNIAYGVPQAADVDHVVALVKAAFQGLPFAWWVPPSQHNIKITNLLTASGFVIQTAEHAMACALNMCAPIEFKTTLNVKQVTDKTALEDFIRVIEPYDFTARAVYEKIHTFVLQKNEKLFVGYVDDVPVTIGVLFICKDSAGIFSLITDANFQGNGYGRDMMVSFMQTAKAHGCVSVTLSASSEAGYRIYERLGFFKVGEFECFEYSNCNAV